MSFNGPGIVWGSYAPPTALTDTGEVEYTFGNCPGIFLKLLNF